MDVRGLHIWIVGAARSGIAAARLLHERGARLFVTDLGKIGDEEKKILTDLKIPFEEGQHTIERLLKEAQLVVLSPSIPLDKPLPMAVRQSGIPLVSEIEVASWFIPPSAIVIGITGTNGKSTTTHYAAQLFALGQRNSVACGNYGRPLADALMDPARYNAFVTELSSYQLETTYSLQPDVSIFLNLQNDHQARYGSLDEYLKAKWRLVALTRSTGLVVIDESVLRRAIAIGLPLPESRITVIRGLRDARVPLTPLNEHPANQTLRKAQSRSRAHLPIPTYGLTATLPMEAQIDPDKLSYVWIEKSSTDERAVTLVVQDSQRGSANLTLEIKDPCLPGVHNQINIAAASLAAMHDGMHANIIRAQWNSATTVYKHLSHRLEDVSRGRLLVSAGGNKKSLRAINDSKATNVESTLVAVQSFSHSIRLLLGGEPKGDFYGELLPYVGKNICKIYPFGRAAPLICQQLSGIGDRLAPPSAKMLDAARLALEESEQDDVLLLSPACASFDEFKNFEHRGDAFRHWILQHMEK
ncbi:MAG: hypothetical protein RLZZ488_296 [Pseudomonadota bacterium]|jgi:UDP-N-acetylmuramoylalanine--D-glutamate ligase